MQLGMKCLEQLQGYRLINLWQALSHIAWVYERALLICDELPVMAKGVQCFWIKPWSSLICELKQKLTMGLSRLRVRNTELQLQSKVVEARGWR